MPKIKNCPFCGHRPSGRSFVSTQRGPALICDHCEADGPPALDGDMVGGNEERYNKQAIKRWNTRSDVKA